ncbi:sensor histidine kinase [Oscillospiraceae bacterium OttesenSCG-928-G22]|nr:sensor histidine kinase [Oscillospiraceae bacterium OttesenSCG-928-G22]
MKKDMKGSLKNWLANYGRLTLLLIAVTLVVFAMLRWFDHYLHTDSGAPKVDVWVSYEPDTFDYDLSEVDFGGHNVARLDLNLLYYPSQLLTPETVDSARPTQMVPGNTLDEYVTQRWILQMPQEDRAYKIYFYHVRYATLAYVNGAFAGQSGQPADNVGDIVISREPLIVYGTADENGQMDVLLQTASFLHWEDPAFLAELWISRADYDYKLPIDELSGRKLVVGALIGFTLLLIGMFIAFPRQPANLYFALCCFMMAVRSGVEGDVMTQFLPFMTPNIVYLLYHMSIPILTLLFALYLSRVFPRMIPRWSLLVIGTATAAFIITCLATEPVFYTSLRRWYQILTEAAMLVFTVRLIIKLRRPTPEQAVSLFGIILFFLAVTYDIARYLNWFDLIWLPADMSDAFMLVFVLTQMVALFLGSSRAAVEARAAERRAEADKEALARINELKTEFLANISHEMKTPLAVMSGYAQDSQKTLQDSPEYAEVEQGMKLIASEADRLALMVGQVLDVSKIDEGRMSLDAQLHSITEIIQGTLNLYAPVFGKGGNRIAFAPEEDLPSVLCDRDRTAQVLVNLLSNAARHTHEGTITVSAEKADDFVRVTVADTGEGIPPEQMPQLFERYKSGAKKARGGKETGTGLGLFICKHIVEAQGGGITVESDPGKGTSVALTIPAHS